MNYTELHTAVLWIKFAFKAEIYVCLINLLYSFILNLMLQIRSRLSPDRSYRRFQLFYQQCILHKRGNYKKFKLLSTVHLSSLEVEWFQYCKHTNLLLHLNYSTCQKKPKNKKYNPTNASRSERKPKRNGIKVHLVFHMSKTTLKSIGNVNN